MKEIIVKQEEFTPNGEKINPIVLVENNNFKLNLELSNGKVEKEYNGREFKGKFVLENKKSMNTDILNLRKLKKTDPKEFIFNFNDRNEFAILMEAMKEGLIFKTEEKKTDENSICVWGEEYFSGKSMFLLSKQELKKLKNVEMKDISSENLKYILDNKEKLDLFIENVEKLEDLEKIVTGIRLKEFDKFIKFYDENRTSDEKTWQKFLRDNNDFLSLIFTTRATLITNESYVGGKSFYNKNGNNVDFLFKEKSFNVSLIEIKRFDTPLIDKKEYRSGIYKVSKEVVGGLQQVLEYKNSTIEEFENLIKNSKNTLPEHSEEYNMLSKLHNHGVKTILIIGDSKSLDNGNKRKAFDNFRNQLKDVEIITFDELLDKVLAIKEFIGYKNEI